MPFDYKAVFTKANTKADGPKMIAYPMASGPIRIAVADSVVSDIIQQKIKDGRYEKHEAKTIQRIVTGNDVLFELGAGVGVISTLAWATGKVFSVHCFEADPRLCPLIAATHAENGVKSTIHNQILSNDPEQIAAGSVDFHIRENFYGSSLNSRIGREIKETVKVPVASIQKAIDETKPTIIACDIEGGELGLFDDVNMPSVQKIMLETHQTALGGEGMRQVFHAMHKADFHYDERYSSGSVSVFTRIIP